MLQTIRQLIQSIWKSNVRFCAALFLIALIITGVQAMLLPEYDNLTYETYDASFEAEIDNFYWFDVPLKKGVWTYTVGYTSSQNLVTRVYPMNEDVNVAHLLYGISESPLPYYKNQASFTIVVMDETVPTGVELRGETGSVRNNADVPFFVSFTYRPRLTLVYRIYRPLSLLVLIFFMRLWLRSARSKETDSERYAVFALVPLLLFICTPLFMNGILHGHDTSYHMMRIDAIATGLKSGMFPVRLQPGWFNDYGYPNGVFYPDLLLYIPAALRLLGLPIWKCYQLFLIMIHSLTVVISYHCFRKMADDAIIGWVVCALYSGSAWYLTDAYFRGAAGELSGMAFMPPVMLGFWYLYKEERRSSVIYLTLGYTGLIQSHTLSPFMAAVFSFLLCVICVAPLIKRRLMPTLLHAAGLTCLINAGILIPLLQSYTQGIRGAGASTVLLQEKGVSLTQLLMLEPDNTIGKTVLVRYDGIAGEMAHTTGLALLLMFAVGLFLLIIRTESAQLYRETGVLCLLGAFSLFLATDLFPYQWLEDHMPLLHGIFGNSIQFPVRYLTMSVLLLSGVAACVLKNLMQGTQERKTFGAILIVITLIFTIYQGGYLMSGWINSSEMNSQWKPFLAKDMEELEYDQYPIFCLDGTHESDAEVSGLQATDERLLVESMGRKGFTFSGVVSNTSDREIELIFPVWNYRGYKADIDTGSLEIYDDPQRRVSVTVPAGYQGPIWVRWAEPVLWRLAEIVSVAGAVYFALHYLWQHKKKETNE